MESRKFCVDVSQCFSISVKGIYRPGYEAPKHYKSTDDPKFSDPGGPPEINDVKIYLGQSDITNLIDKDTKEDIIREAMDAVIYEDNEYDEDYDQ